MKLVFCPHCQDMFKLDREMKQCKCGESKGIYNDSVNATVFGSAIPVCIGWTSFVKAIRNRPADTFEGEHFTAWIPPIECETIKQEVTDDKH